MCQYLWKDFNDLDAALTEILKNLITCYHLGIHLGIFFRRARCISQQIKSCKYRVGSGRQARAYNITTQECYPQKTSFSILTYFFPFLLSLHLYFRYSCRYLTFLLWITLILLPCLNL